MGRVKIFYAHSLEDLEERIARFFDQMEPDETFKFDLEDIKVYMCVKGNQKSYTGVLTYTYRA